MALWEISSLCFKPLSSERTVCTASHKEKGFTGVESCLKFCTLKSSPWIQARMKVFLCLQKLSIHPTWLHMIICGICFPNKESSGLSSQLEIQGQKQTGIFSF